jgi:hypothetical protein
MFGLIRTGWWFWQKPTPGYELEWFFSGGPSENKHVTAAAGCALRVGGVDN